MSIRIGLALLLLAALGAAQTAPQDEFEGRTVLEIEFVGANLASPDAVRAKMKTKKGRPLRRAELNEDIHTLVENLKLFSTVDERLLPSGDGVKVSLYVTENPRIEVLIFLGNEHFKREELLEAIDSREGGLADELTLKLDQKRVIEKYRRDGYHFAQVQYQRPADEFTTIIFDITEGPEVCVEEVRFVGNRSFDKDELLEAMPTTDESGFLFGHAFVEDDFRRDLVTLSVFYHGKGFLDAKIALQDRTFSSDKELVYLTVKIEEGEPYVIRSISLRGVQRFDVEEMKKELKSQVGARYEPQFNLLEDLKNIREKYWDDAFINMFPRDASELPEQGHEVDLVIDVTEGERVRIGDVRIRGNIETRDRVIRRLLEDLVPGSPLNLNTLERSKQRLISLRYFEPSTFDILKTDVKLSDFRAYQKAFVSVEDTDRDNVKDIEVKVEEVDTGSIRFAVGVNSDAGLVGAIVYRKENFDPFDFPEGFGDILDAFTGGGQSLEIAFFPGIELTQFSITYAHPFIFDSDYEFTTSLFRRFRIREDWDETRTGFNVGFGRRFGVNIAGSLRYRYELVDVDDIDNDAGQIVFDFEGERLISSLTAGLTIADLDNFGTPTEGYRINTSYEYAGLGGDLDFHKILTRAEYYLTLHEDIDERRHVLFFRGQVGYVTESAGTRDVPIYERFFAGGQNSIRGFEFRGVGPMTNGSPDGGKVLVLGSANYQFPLYEQVLAGVVFLDTGTLAQDFSDDDLSRFRASIGFGIRLKIDFLGPVPFAVDFGIPLIKRGDDQTQLISFSLDRQF